MTTRSTSVAEVVGFDERPVGRWIEGPPLTVTSASLDAYADAVDADPGPASAPLVSILACYPILFAAVDAVTPVAARNRMVHGEHDVTIHRPVIIGETLTARGRPLAVTRTPAGARIKVELQVFGPQAQPVATHLLTAVARGVHPERDLGTAPAPWPDPDGRRPELDQEVAVPVAPDQTRRYADATGDANAVHLDPEQARRAGFPDIIAHGLGALGLVASALVRAAGPADPSRLARLRARFSAPVVPGRALILRLGSDGDLLAFAVEDPDGTLVLRDGWASFR